MTTEVKVANSVLTLGGQGGALKATLSSAIADTSAPYHKGNIFNGGAYFEARLRFDPTQTINETVTHPAWWAEDIAHVQDQKDGGAAQQWPGQAADYAHFIELDFFEAYPTAGDYTGKTTYLSGIHDWSGIYNGTTYPTNLINSFNNEVGAVDWNQWHTYGCLWVPETATDPGYVQYFFDDVAGSKTYFQGPVGDPPLPNQSQSTPETATRTFSLIDERSLALTLWADPFCAMEVDWVKVWQT